jgi:4-alpha-glucanotransferase
LHRDVAADVAPVAAAALEWLGRTDAALVLADLEDLWLEDAPQNVPGTSSHERPNWQRRLDRSTDAAFAADVVGPLDALDAARRSDPLPEVPT